MSATGRILRAARTANRAERAVTDPGRYARQRGKSRVLGLLGFWRLTNKIWRA